MRTSTTTPTAAQAAAGPRGGTQVGWKQVQAVATAAAVTASLTWLATVIFGGVDLVVRTTDGGTREIGLVSIIVTSMVAAFVGGGVLRWWQRRSPQGTRSWTALAVGVAVLSLLGPTAARTGVAAGTLLSLHAVVAVVVIVGLRRASRAAGASNPSCRIR